MEMLALINHLKLVLHPQYSYYPVPIACYLLQGLPVGFTYFGWFSRIRFFFSPA
jgi:hypothetical protein